MCTRKRKTGKRSDKRPGFLKFSTELICLNSLHISNPSRSGAGIDISQIFKSISFQLNVFDKAEWHAIDDRIVTELHDKLQMLPCAFPHAEYLRENYVKYPIEMKATKANKTPSKQRRVCPVDDAHLIKKKIEAVKLKKMGRTKQSKRITAAKRLKRATKRAKKAMTIQARKVETKEFESTKKLLLATMDQYNTLSGETLSNGTIQNANAGNSSIAANTRNRTKISTPEKSTRPTRRTSMNQSYSDKNKR